jgi:hypothetical protein
MMAIIYFGAFIKVIDNSWNTNLSQNYKRDNTLKEHSVHSIKKRP